MLVIALSTAFFPAAAAQSTCVSVRDTGAIGDGLTDDTRALQTALDQAVTGSRAVCVPAGRYLTEALRVSNGVTRISGPGELVQRSLGVGQAYSAINGALFGGGLLNVIGVTGLTIDGLRFTGITGTVAESANDAVFVISSSGVTVQSSTFTGWRHQAVDVQNSTNVVVQDNVISGISRGLSFTGVRGGRIQRNTLSSPQLPNSTFTVAIKLDSTDGHAFGICDRS